MKLGGAVKEQEWLTLATPTQSVFKSLFVRVAQVGKKNPHYPEKLRRFAIACCRRMGRVLTANDIRALDHLDHYCDTLSAKILKEARAAYNSDSSPQPWDTWDERNSGNMMLWWARHHAKIALESCLKGKAAQTVRGHQSAAQSVEALRIIGAGELPTGPVTGAPEPSATELAAQSDILRDIFGNPFRPVTFDAKWRTSTALALAEQMYGTREFSAMPILADALQDAGCDNEGILEHCRWLGPHVRGCWVVDLVLGKE
jgi:hypothetical protein